MDSKPVFKKERPNVFANYTTFFCDFQSGRNLFLWPLSLFLETWKLNDAQVMDEALGKN